MIVVTGAAGFIGSNLVATLEAEGGVDVVVCDLLNDDSGASKWRNLQAHAPAEIVPPDELLPFLGRHRDDIEAVVHLGAISSTTATDADLVVRNNFTFSSHLWDWCVSARRPFLYASSAATYGDGSAQFDDDLSLSYLKRLRPLNLYAWSKHLFDCRVSAQVARRIAPPQWAGLKFFNVYGPNEQHKGPQKSIVAQAYDGLRRHGRIRLFSSTTDGLADGDQARDFVSVDDCVSVILWLLQHGDVSGLFNVGTGRARTFNAVARAVIHAAGGVGTIEYFDMPPQIARAYQNHTEADVRRLRAAGYDRPFRTLEDGVTEYVQSYLLSGSYR
jgi:ADP-L-glycero-D-manno-heptose 6-epimerase